MFVLGASQGTFRMDTWRHIWWQCEAGLSVKQGKGLAEPWILPKGRWSDFGSEKPSLKPSNGPRAHECNLGKESSGSKLHLRHIPMCGNIQSRELYPYKGPYQLTSIYLYNLC